MLGNFVRENTSSPGTPIPRARFFERLARCAAAAAGAAVVATTTFTALAAPQVALLVESPPSPVQPGDTLVYRIHLSNSNQTTATGPLVVTADIPQNTYVTQERWGDCSPSRCNASNVARYGDTVSWKKELGPGQSTSWSVTVYVDNSVDHPPPADGSKVALDVVAKAGATKAAGAAASVVLRNAPAPFELAVTGATRAEPGQQAEYAVRYGNASSAAAAARLSFPIPAGASVLSASSGAALKGNSVEWDLGSVPAGHSDVRAVRLRLDPRAAAGTLFAVQPELRASGRDEPARASLGVHVGAASPLVLKAVAAPDPATPGATVVYKLELVNQSRDAPTGAFNVSANIPVHGIVTQMRGADCAPYRCNASNTSRYGSHVIWEVPSLAPGATAPLQYAFIIDKPGNAAPPPNGSVLATHISTSLGAEGRVTLALGTAPMAGKGKPMEPLGASPPQAAAKPSPAAPPPPVEAVPVAVVVPETEPEPAVEEIPEAEIAAELPPADDEAKLAPAEVQVRKGWKRGDWDKYCERRWKAQKWDRVCAKRWWKRKDWNQYCTADNLEYRGWKKFCARDFGRWKFVKRGKHESNQGKSSRNRRKEDKGR